MAYKSPREKLKMISQREIEEGLFEQAFERLLAEAAEEAGLPSFESVHNHDAAGAEGRIVYDKFDTRPR